MDPLLNLLLTIFVIGTQTFFGYVGNKYLGAILPVLFSGFVIYLLMTGNLHFSFTDITMPFLGLGTLIMLWEGGNESKKKKLNKELEKMKAKDYQRNN